MSVSSALSACSLLRTTIVLLSLLVFVSAECPPNKDCGEFGECILDTKSCGDICEERCKCLPGYVGFDCSYSVEICTDEVIEGSVQSCYNGGKCVPVEPGEAIFASDETQYRCDCSEAYGLAGSDIHAGHQCEFPAEMSCEKDSDKSVYSFCVNQGVCTKQIAHGEPHPGCICPKDFEGWHCQFKVGTAPAEEYEYQIPNSGNGGLSGVAIFFIVAISLVVFALIVFVAVRVKRRQRANHSTDPVSMPGHGVQPGPGDLALEEDEQDPAGVGGNVEESDAEII